MTLLTARALTDLRLPATASNVCRTDARLGGVGRVPPPNKNPSYAGVQRATGEWFHTSEFPRDVCSTLFSCTPPFEAH